MDINSPVDLGDLKPVEWCEPCKFGEHDKCTADYSWRRRDPLYGRCGEFEEIKMGELSDRVGHGVILRTRQPRHPNTPMILAVRGFTPVGWIVGVGEDEVGQFVEVD